MARLRTRAQVGAVSTLLAAGALTVPGALTAQAAVTAPIACPDAFPTAQAVDGVTGTGFTVERGTTPEPFTANVLGRITDGIAPGIDMILADVSSPALTRAGGVWAGMSGSPVYTADGRLIGSVSYGLAASSPIAGITPAADMKKLLDNPAGFGALKQKVAVSKATAERIARTGDVTAAAAQSGFTRLKVPVTMSGVSAGHVARVQARLQKKYPNMIFTAGSAAPGSAAPADEITAGGNFAAAISYGTATLGGVGTTTFVCDGQAVSFGHPFAFTGADVTYSAHTASAVLVQPDPVFGPFKVANIGGIAGTIEQDRLAGLKTRLGATPATTAVTTSFAVDGAPATTLRTRSAAQPFLPDVTFNHMLAAVDRGLDKIGPGSGTINMRIRGLRPNGKAFDLKRTDKVSSNGDLALNLAFRAADTVFALTSNEFEDIRITSIAFDGTLSSKASDYRVTAFKVRSAGKFIPAPATINVREGGVLTTQLTLSPYRNQGPAKLVEMPIAVPRGSGNGSGSLTVAAGEAFPTSEPTSFYSLLSQLRSTPGPDSLRLVMSVQNFDTGRTVTSRVSAKADRAVVPYENAYGVSSRR
jgi:hypothetical protein